MVATDRRLTVTQAQVIGLTSALAGKVDRTDGEGGAGELPEPHAATHAEGGSDVVTLAQSQVTGLTTALDDKVDDTDSRLSDARVPTAHATTHETGGSDAIDTLDASVLTSGTLPDARLSANVQLKPIAAGDLPAHATRHQVGGSDPLAVTTLGGYPGGTATFLRADGSFAAPPVGGTPGGATTQVQFNDGGTFGGDTELTFDKTTGSLIVGRMLNINSSVIRKSTADGADNQYVVLCGGGGESPARGALFYVLGNEYGSGQSGNVEFYLGNVAGSTFKVKNAGGSDVVIVDGATGRLGLSMVPDARLCIRQSGNGAGGGLRVVRSDAATYGELYMGSDDALYLQNNGLGYISLASTGATFISGSLTTWGGILPATDNAATCGGSGKRWSAVWAANGTIQTSDRRHKRDIAASDGLAFVNQLRPVRYRWRDGAEADRVQHGLIAQDLIALGATDYVHGNDAEGYGLNYSSFVAPLIAAVQELSRRLAALERTTDGAL